MSANDKLNKAFTNLKNSIRTADDSSSKIPVTDLNKAPLRGADSNLHRHKNIRKYATSPPDPPVSSSAHTPPTNNKRHTTFNDDVKEDNTQYDNTNDINNADMNTDNLRKNFSDSWTDEIDYLLFHLFMHCKLLASQHHNRYTFFRNRLKRYRIPIILLSAINAYIAVGFQPYMEQTTISTINSVLSLFTGILTSIELFLNVQKKMEKELVSYNDFYRLSVDIMKILWIKKEDRKEDGGKFLEKKYNDYLNAIENGNAGRPSQYKNIFDSLSSEYLIKLYNDVDKNTLIGTSQYLNILSPTSSAAPSKVFNENDTFPIIMCCYRSCLKTINGLCCITSANNSHNHNNHNSHSHNNNNNNNHNKMEQIKMNIDAYDKFFKQQNMDRSKSFLDLLQRQIIKVTSPNEYMADKSKEDYENKMSYFSNKRMSVEEKEEKEEPSSSSSTESKV
jgi:hypothetical protein